MELLKTVVPEIAQLTVLVNPTNPNTARQLGETEAAARSIGVRLKILRIQSTAEFDKAISGMGRAPATALFISSDPVFFAERRRIADIVLANRMPAMGFGREFAEDGILMDLNRSWSIDDKRLNFQFGCEIGWEIKNGKLGRMLRNPTYTGIGPQFWQSMDMLGNDVIAWGTPNCGKGQPGQTGHTGHPSPAARFTNVRVGVTG